MHRHKEKLCWTFSLVRFTLAPAFEDGTLIYLTSLCIDVFIYLISLTLVQFWGYLQPTVTPHHHSQIVQHLKVFSYFTTSAV